MIFSEKGDLDIVTFVLSARLIPSPPSAYRRIGPPSLDDPQTERTASSLKSTGRAVSVCAQIGVTRIERSVGSTTGPPAESEYAVDPVGVEKISPSAR